MFRLQLGDLIRSYTNNYGTFIRRQCLRIGTALVWHFKFNGINICKTKLKF